MTAPKIIGFDDQGRVMTAPEAPAQTMRERLIAAAAQKLQAYDFGYDEAR